MQDLYYGSSAEERFSTIALRNDAGADLAKAAGSDLDVVTKQQTCAGSLGYSGETGTMSPRWWSWLRDGSRGRRGFRYRPVRRRCGRDRNILDGVSLSVEAAEAATHHRCIVPGIGRLRYPHHRHGDRPRCGLGRQRAGC